MQAKPLCFRLAFRRQLAGALDAHIGGQHLTGLQVDGPTHAIDQKSHAALRSDRHTQGQQQHQQLTVAPLTPQQPPCHVQSTHLAASVQKSAVTHA